MISADDVEAEFRAKALIPGTVLILSVHDAIAMIARAKNLSIPIKGVDGFRISGNSVQPDTGLTLDCSKSTTGCWEEAEKFIRAKMPEANGFEVVLGDPEGRT